MANKGCDVCGAPSGEYTLCSNCFEKMQNGEIKQCPNCHRWHYSDRQCSCTLINTTPKSHFNDNSKPNNDQYKSANRILYVLMCVVVFGLLIFCGVSNSLFDFLCSAELFVWIFTFIFALIYPTYKTIRAKSTSNIPHTISKCSSCNSSNIEIHSIVATQKKIGGIALIIHFTSSFFMVLYNYVLSWFTKKAGFPEFIKGFTTLSFFDASNQDAFYMVWLGNFSQIFFVTGLITFAIYLLMPYKKEYHLVSICKNCGTVTDNHNNNTNI